MFVVNEEAKYSNKSYHIAVLRPLLGKYKERHSGVSALPNPCVTYDLWVLIIVASLVPLLRIKWKGKEVRGEKGRDRSATRGQSGERGERDKKKETGEMKEHAGDKREGERAKRKKIETENEEKNEGKKEERRKGREEIRKRKKDREGNERGSKEYMYLASTKLRLFDYL